MSDAAESQDGKQGLEQGLAQEAKQANQTAAEDTARQGGWRPESEWDDDDPKKPETFSSAEVFNARGEFIGRMKAQDKRLSDMEAQFNTRLDNSNKLHKAQMELQKAELIRKRDDAIDLADRSAANGFQNDIDNLDTPNESAPANNQQAVLDGWNQSNPWVFQAGPKSAYAQSQLNVYLGANQDVNTAIANMEADIAREFPALNANRDNHPIPEGGSKAGGGRKTGRSLSMADLTAEEARIWKISGKSWATEKEFLQSVQDIRSES